MRPTDPIILRRVSLLNSPQPMREPERRLQMLYRPSSHTLTMVARWSSDGHDHYHDHRHDHLRLRMFVVQSAAKLGHDFELHKSFYRGGEGRSAGLQV